MIRTQFLSRAASGTSGNGRGRLLSSTALTAVVLVVGVGLAAPAFAADKYFDGNSTVSDNFVDGGSGIWDVNTTTNWTDITGTANIEWQNGDDAFFGTIGGTVQIVDPVDVNNMTFTADGYDITLGGGGSLSISNGSTISVSSGNTATISAVVGGGAATLDKVGDGTLVLSGANTFLGDVTVSAGTLALDGGSALEDTVAVILNASGAILDVNADEEIGSLAGAAGTSVLLDVNTLTTGGNNDSTTFGGVISGSGGITKTGTGTFTLSGVNTFTGSAIVSGGTLTLEAGSALEDTVAVNLDTSGAVLDVNANEEIGSLAGVAGTSVLLDVNRLTTGGNNGSTTFAGVIGGSGGITKIGTGTFTLSGVNTFTGSAIVSGGTLALDGGSALEDTVAVNLDTSGATLDVNANEEIGSLAGVAGTSVLLDVNRLTTGGNNGSTTFAGVISGSGGITKTGTGTFTLSGVNTFTGSAIVSGGTLALDGGSALEDTVAVNLDTSGATLDVNANEEIGSLAGVAGTSVTLDVNRLTTGGNDGSTTFAGVISGSGGITKTGTGTFTLSGTNTFTGSAIVSEGTLVLDGGSALEDTVAVNLDTSGAVLDVNATEEIGSLAGVAGTSVTLDTFRLIFGGNDTSTSFAGSISGSTGGVTKTGSGTFTLASTGSTTYTGMTTVNEGVFDNQGSIGGDIEVLGATLNNTGSIGGTASTDATGVINANTGGSFNHVDNAGTFNVNVAILTLGGNLANTGNVHMDDGAANQSLTVGDFSGNGTITLDTDVSNLATSDVFYFTGTAGNSTTIDFNILNPNAQVYVGDILVVDGSAANGASFDASNLPSSNGLVIYGFERQGDDWYLTTDINPEAPGSIAANVAIVQATIGAVVNRPSSAFVTGLAAAEAGHCGAGPWLRGTGGNATASGTTTGGDLTSTSEVDLEYAGIQFGLDMACFNTDGEGFDIAYGAIGGYNQGSTTQNLSNDSTTASDFTQGYGGVYISGHKGQVSFDLQARVDYSDFTFDNSSINLVDAKLDTTRYSVGGSASYAMSVSGLDVVPNAGFNASLTKSGSIDFGNDQTLTPEDAVNLVAFAGGSVAKLFVVSNNTAAIVPFVSGNIYNDFAGPSTSTFENPNAPGGPIEFESTNLGMFGELSVGVNYAKIFGEQDLRQMSATVRVDAKYSDTVTGLGVTAQVRGQF